MIEATDVGFVKHFSLPKSHQQAVHNGYHVHNIEKKETFCIEHLKNELLDVEEVASFVANP